MASRFIKNKTRLQREDGVALIFTISMLAIISLLGVIALSITQSELGIATNYRCSNEAFSAAERAVEYVVGNTDIVFSTTDTDLDASPHRANLTVGKTGLVVGAGNMVTLLGTGDLPSRIADRFGTDFGAFYFCISLTGSGPNGRAAVELETEKVRVFHKEDEAILETTSGG